MHLKKNFQYNKKSYNKKKIISSSVPYFPTLLTSWRATAYIYQSYGKLRKLNRDK